MPLRVVSGEARGRLLRVPKKAETRPTTDRIKGVIFSMLEAEAYKRGFEPEDDGALASGLAWPRVLDLFAGSGALGIEALSRGATSATFVDSDRDAAETIHTNLRTLGLEARTTVVRTSVEAALPRLHGPFDLVLLDPPYADGAKFTEAVDALARLADQLLGEASVVITEQAATTPLPEAIGPLPLRTTRTHGRTKIALYAKEPPGNPEAD